MKRIITVLVFIVAMLISCTESERLPLEALPSDYSLADAAADGCVIFEDGDVTCGKEVFEDFLGSVENGRSASVRLGFYYTLDSSSVSREYYDENKDRYPVLYISDLYFDGEVYEIRSVEGGKVTARKFSYLKYLPFYPKNIEADYERIDYYVLLNDNGVSSYDEIWRSLVSSRFGDYIEHSVVYSEYVRK